MKIALKAAATTYCLLSLAGAGSILTDSVVQMSSASAQSNVLISGLVHDFRNNDPDFAAVPSAGNGHYAGNVALTLGANGKPVFTGKGYKVASEWRNKLGRNIAPHTYMYDSGGATAIPVTLASVAPPKAVFDTYNSGTGVYNPLTAGASPVYDVGAPMPEIVIPLSLRTLANAGDRTFAGVSTISSNLHCKKLTVSGTLTVNGNVSILCEDVFTLANGSIVTLAPNARLTMYLKNGGMSWNFVTLGDPLDPSRTMIYNMGTAQFGVHNQAKVYANFTSPNASLYIYNQANYYGRFIGKMLEFNNHAGFHHDLSGGRDACNALFGDAAGAKGGTSTGGIPSAAAFNKWYTDTMGSNLSMHYELELADDGTGVYEYLDDGFYPIDGQLFGNQGQSHNYYFTYQFEATFTYKSCGGEFMQFQGNDDVWVFIDGGLAIDLAGVIPGVAQTIDLDRLNLVNGQTYQLRFFYAQRNSSISTFRLRTNLELFSESDLGTVNAGHD